MNDEKNWMLKISLDCPFKVVMCVRGEMLENVFVEKSYTWWEEHVELILGVLKVKNTLAHQTQ